MEGDMTALFTNKIPAFEKAPAATLAVANQAEQTAMGLQNFGREQARQALATLERYRKGKAALEERMIEENMWWRRRHFDLYKKDADGKPLPRKAAGAQLFNSIENKLADLCDNIPECAFLARSQDDEGTAKNLTSVMPCVLEQAGSEKAYAGVTREKVAVGTGVYTVLWDQDKLNGLGDVDIKNVSALNCYWEPAITDIQLSPHFFFVHLESREVLESEYPVLKDKLTLDTSLVAEYIYEDHPDDSMRVPVIDYYYKRKVGTRTVLHYAKLCADEVLYASENDPAYAERGWYDHGKYPFVFDVMFPLAGTPCGFGYVSVGKDGQHQIDTLTNAITKNAVIATTRRKFIRKDANVRAEDLMNLEKEVIEVNGSRDVREYVLSVEEPVLSSTYVSVLSVLEDTLKEVTANRDFAQGGTSGGVTSGTAISALVEAGNKQSRSIIRGSYEAYKEVCTLAYELVRQFYDMPRAFRITGESGNTEYMSFSNAALVSQPQTLGGVDLGAKAPVFDIMIRPHKKSPFARITQNTMMQEFYGMGFFAPENATQALACLEGMEFDGKDTLCRRLEENGTVYSENMQLKQSLLRLAGMIDIEKGTSLTAEMAAAFGMDVSAFMPKGDMNVSASGAPDIMQSQTDPRMQKSAERIAESTSV